MQNIYLCRVGKIQSFEILRATDFYQLGKVGRENYFFRYDFTKFFPIETFCQIIPNRNFTVSGRQESAHKILKLIEPLLVQRSFSEGFWPYLGKFRPKKSISII